MQNQENEKPNGWVIFMKVWAMTVYFRFVGGWDETTWGSVSFSDSC